MRHSIKDPPPGYAALAEILCGDEIEDRLIERDLRAMHDRKLIEEWKKIHKLARKIDNQSDKGGADWKSLCVGWCLGKGLSVPESFAFYEKVLDLNLG